MSEKSSPWKEGNPDSSLVIVGEAPTKFEMKLGRPLIGPSGDVLNDCLHQAGIARKQAFVINLWPMQVQKDKKGTIWFQGERLWHSRGLTELGLELAQDTIEELKASKANVVMPMGAPALEACYGKRLPITKWRGSPLWGSRISKKLMPTFHPAATIHGKYVWRYLIINDMMKLQDDLSSPLLNVPKRDIKLRPTLSEVYQYIEACREARRFNFDLEILNHQVYCLSLCHDPAHAIVVPFIGPTGQDYWSEEDEIWFWKQFAGLLGDPDIMKCNQNLVGFDGPFLLNKCNIHMDGPLGDCMIANHIIYPELKKDLGTVSSMHTREPYWKDDGKVHKNIKIDWDVFQRYCGTDSCTALESWIALEKELDEGGFRKTYDMTVRMAGPIAYMSTVGLAVDRSGLDETNAKITKAIEEKERELEAAVGHPLNVNSPLECKTYFYEELGLKPYLNMEGSPTVDDKALTRIIRKSGVGSVQAKIVQELRNLKKLKSTYLDVETDKDGRLRCSWNPRGTWTGRLSSSETILGTGMNLQNLDPRFKGFIVAG